MATTELIRDPTLQPYAGRDTDAAHDDNRTVLFGDSGAVRHLRSQIQHIAPYFRVAVIRGERGSGKAVVARAIHAHSAGALGPFIVADAADLADSVADAPHPLRNPSLADRALGGTLYLRRTTELTAMQQDALMRFFRNVWERRTTVFTDHRRNLERRQPHSERARYRGVRILFGVDHDLRALTAVGRFRQDLYAELAAVEIVVPPLRERREDIPILATWLLRRLEEQTGQPQKHFSQATLAHLQERRWPRNLNELEEVVAQATALSTSSLIEPESLLARCEPEVKAPMPPAPQRVERLNEVVHRHVLDVLTRCGGNKLRAAEQLGISRSTLYRMLDSNTDAISVFSS